MLNRGYPFTTIISRKYHGQPLLSHLASLYPHSTPQAWEEYLNNREVTVDGVTATGSESLIAGQILVWNRPPWIEPGAPQHFEVLLDDPHLLAVNKPGGLPTLPGGGFMENTLLRLVQKQIPNANPVHLPPVARRAYGLCSNYRNTLRGVRETTPYHYRANERARAGGS